jgi:peptidoglycan/LPS O-acetylase OafA/YrhL
MVWVNPLTRIDPFAIGALCAVLFYEKPAWLSMPYLGSFCLVGGVLGLSLIAETPSVGWTQHTSWQLLVVAASGGLLLMSALTHGGIGSLLGWAPLRFLGKISFGLYVYHLLALELVGMLERAGFAFSFGPRLMITLVICVTFAAASYLLWERRFLRLKQRYELVRSRPS